MSAYLMEEMTWPETRDALRETKVAIIPVGSQEQHGPHLALSVDIASAESFARQLGEAVRPRALVTAPLKFGVSIHHMRFPGTLTLQPETFQSVLRDVAWSLREHGIRRLFVVNGHGGNQASLGVLSATLRRDLGVRMAYTLWPIVGSRAVGDAARGRRVGHACLLETSLMMHLRPDLVRANALSEAELKPPLYGETSTAGIDGFVYWDELTGNGALEGATEARPELGEQITRTALERVSAFVRRFADLPLDEELAGP